VDIGVITIDVSPLFDEPLVEKDQEIAVLYDDGVVHRTEPFISPQAEALHA
jgi:hypothetical protein